MSDILVSDGTLLICQWVLFTGVCQSVDIFGTVANIINIICFVKQGFHDPVNISLFGLAVSDLGCLITQTWTNICLTPAFMTTDLPFEPTESQYVTAVLPHTTFTRASSWITALITLERCLCITIPLKVKNLITRKRVSVIVICIFVAFIVTAVPAYMANGLGMKYFPHVNKTLIGLIYKIDNESAEKAWYILNQFIAPLSAFFIISACTLVLVLQLRNKTKWRKKSSTTAQADNVTSRNQKVASMVLMISILFIACFIPSCIGFLTMAFEPELSFAGKYRNVGLLTAGVNLILESINASVNIFIYYHMSSKYRTTFHQLFCVKE